MKHYHHHGGPFLVVGAKVQNELQHLDVKVQGLGGHRYTNRQIYLTASLRHVSTDFLALVLAFLDKDCATLLGINLLPHPIIQLDIVVSI